MSRLRYYRAALANLGVGGTIRRSLARRAAPGTVGPVTSKWSDHPVHARGGTSDMLVFDQIFVDREYRCLDGLSDVRTIVDAGANVGYSTAYLLSRFPQARAVCLEPDPANYAAARRNLAAFGDRAVLRQVALWNEPTTLDFRADTTTQGQEWGRKVEPAPSGGVAATDMPTLLAEHGFATVDLLKIDIEGAEETVFAPPDTSWLDRVDNIVIELHGEACATAFMRAIGDRYVVSTCDELTVCLSRR